LIKTTAELSKGLVQKLVCVTPLEYDHYREKDPQINATQSEKAAKEIFPELVHLKVDLTFGDKAGALNDIIKRIVSGQSISFNPISSAQQSAPIHVDDLASIVQVALKEDALKGKSFVVEGPNQIGLSDLIAILEKHVGKSAQLNSSFIEKLIAPYSKNLISEKIYAPAYRNLVGLLRNYRTLDKQGFNDLSGFKLNLTTLDDTYKERGVNESQYKIDTTDIGIKHFLY